METNQRLYRTRNGVLAGVCGGMADYFGLKRGLIRLATAILILFAGHAPLGYNIPRSINPRRHPKHHN